MKTTKEMIEVMQAFERGEQIEVKDLNGTYGWVNTKDPLWDWSEFDYRVKPNTKKTYVPFDTPEEFLAAQREHVETVRCKIDDELYHVYINNRSETILVNHYGRTGSVITNIVNMFDKYEFADGTPCGKEVEL